MCPHLTSDLQRTRANPLTRSMGVCKLKRAAGDTCENDVQAFFSGFLRVCKPPAILAPRPRPTPRCTALSSLQHPRTPPPHTPSAPSSSLRQGPAPCGHCQLLVPSRTLLTLLSSYVPHLHPSLSQSLASPACFCDLFSPFRCFFAHVCYVMTGGQEGQGGKREDGLAHHHPRG